MQTRNKLTSNLHSLLYGEKNPDTLRVIVKLPIDNFTCRELIEQALPYIMEFIAVAKKYGEQFFFDF